MCNPLCMFDVKSRLIPLKEKQGRIHGYPSRMWVGRGCIWGHLIIWAGAVRLKTAKKKRKKKVWWTDGRTDKAVCRVIINVLLSHVAVADVGWLALLLPLLFCHGLICSVTTNKLSIFLSFLDELCRILQNQGNKIRGFGNGKGKMKNMKDIKLKMSYFGTI